MKETETESAVAGAVILVVIGIIIFFVVKACVAPPVAVQDIDKLIEVRNGSGKHTEQMGYLHILGRRTSSTMYIVKYFDGNKIKSLMFDMEDVLILHNYKNGKYKKYAIEIEERIRNHDTRSQK